VSDRSLTAQTLLAAYASGIFPMANSKDDPEVFWVRPEQRGIFPLNGFHMSRSLKRRIQKDQPVVQVNRQFAKIVQACADRDETWINDQIFDLYVELHHLGFAHSIEVLTQDGKLWGGVYGVALGGAFFGESMFSNETDGSKIALTYLIARLKFGGFKLFDTQFLTDHLASLGAIEIPRDHYEKLLAQALEVKGDFSALEETCDVHSTMQLITQTS